MKPKLIPAVSIIIIILLSVIAIAAANQKPKTNIVSWFTADMDNDSNDELLIVVSSNPGMTLDTGEAYGDYIKQYSDFEIVNHEPVIKGEPDVSFDLTDIKPLKIQAGDINGDGVMEIAVCVYKTTKFHPVLAKRPFFYDVVDGGLEPVWLGSRLSRPFDQYILNDLDGDGIDEIISIEQSEHGNRLFAVYDWKGFGFEVKAISDEVEGEAVFLNNRNHKEKDISISIAGENLMLQLENNKLVFTQE